MHAADLEICLESAKESTHELSDSKVIPGDMDPHESLFPSVIELEIPDDGRTTSSC